MEDVVIVDAVRSAIGKKNGSLGLVHPTDTLGPIMMKLLERNNVSSDQVDQVIGGCINKLAAQGMNVTRTAWLSHGGAQETHIGRASWRGRVALSGVAGAFKKK